MTAQEVFQPFHLPGQDVPLGTLAMPAATVLTARGVMHSCAVRGTLTLPDIPVSEALEAVREALFAADMIGAPRHEPMAVRLTADGDMLGTIDRSAVRALGLWVTKVHVNGLVRSCARTPQIWLSRRAKHAAWNPDRFDTLVAGGVAAHQSVDDAVQAECWEEAGLLRDALSGLTPERRMAVQYVSDRGLHRELLLVHDLYLDPDFIPACQDGEIAWAQRFSARDVCRFLTIPDEMKFSSAIVCTDLLDRLGATGANVEKPGS